MIPTGTTNIFDWVNNVACGVLYFKIHDDIVYVYSDGEWCHSSRSINWINEKTYRIGEEPKRYYY